MGRAGSLGFLHSFLNPHQSLSCICGIFRIVPTGRVQHLKYMTILSAMHYFSHNTHHQLKLLVMCLFFSLSLPALPKAAPPP